MYVTYVLKNSEGKKCTGSTRDISDRLKMHNSLNPNTARFHRTTYKKGPWRVIFQKEFATRKEAAHFERYLKTGAGREWLERSRRGE